MELDELKAIWQRIDRNLELQSGLELQRHRETKGESLRAKLRPLLAGQIIQMIAGALLMLLVVAFWDTRPDSVPVILSGIVIHIYAIVLMAVGGQTVSLINRIDYAAPVVTIQKQLAEVRKWYIRSGVATGMAWWLIWIPFLAMLLGLVGVDFYRMVPTAWLLACTAFCVVGLGATWLLHHLSRSPQRPRLATFMRESTTGTSLLKAQQVLDEIAEFEKEYTK